MAFNQNPCLNLYRQRKVWTLRTTYDTESGDLVGRAGLEPATICARNFCVCQADILTRLDDRPKAFREFEGREIKATGRVGRDS